MLDALHSLFVSVHKQYHPMKGPTSPAELPKLLHKLPKLLHGTVYLGAFSWTHLGD